VQSGSARAELGAPPSAARTSVILGVIALVTSLMPVVGIVLGVTAMVKSAGAMDDIRTQDLAGMGVAVAGMVLGILAIVLSFVWMFAAGLAT
jgi:hypothetical protein